MRAPVGGLFRHVADLAAAQAAQGHDVGLIADATTGAARAEQTLAALTPHLTLGLSRIAMPRHLGFGDFAAARHVAAMASRLKVDVLHGHGAKGGAYARLAGGSHLRVYTPHGGSLHYSPRSALGIVYLGLERLLMRRTGLFLFESGYGRDVFTARIGQPACPVRIVHNGVAPEEFAPVVPAPDATDIVHVGELRRLKGVDVLLDAIALLAQRGRRFTATIVGDGPDAAAFRDQAKRLGIADAVAFPGALPARTGFAMGRLLVVPSRAESLPYIVLEAAAAGLPMIATAVGGIGEIFGPDAPALVPAGDAGALADAIAAAFDEPAQEAGRSVRLLARVRAHFSVAAMVDSVIAAYGEARAGSS